MRFKWFRFGLALAALALTILAICFASNSMGQEGTLFRSPIGPDLLDNFHAFLDRSGGYTSSTGQPTAMIARWITTGDWSNGQWLLNFDWNDEVWSVGPTGQSGDNAYNWMAVSNPVSGTIEAGQTRVRIRFYESGVGAGPVLDTFWLKWPDGPINSFWSTQIYDNDLVIDGVPTLRIQSCAWLTATEGAGYPVYRNNNLPQEGYTYFFRGGGGSREYWDRQQDFCEFDVDGPIGDDCQGYSHGLIDPFGLNVLCFQYKPYYHRVSWTGAGASVDDCDTTYTFPCYIETWEHDGTNAHPWRVGIGIRYQPGCGDCAARLYSPTIYRDY